MAKKIKHENGKVYKEVKPFYKSWWFILLAVVVVLGAIGSQGGSKKNETKKEDIKTENVKKEKVVESVNSTEKIEEIRESVVENDVPKEYKSALKSAESYSEMMSMSKAGIYDQLTSEYGDKFTPEAAQYAVDNMEADWKANALKSAENYQEMMSMSPEAIKDQLVSEHGEKFTEEEAQYAIDNLSK